MAVELSIVRELPIQLTETEIVQVARVASKTVGEIWRMKEEKKTTAKFFAAQIEKLESAHAKLNDAVASGTQYRETPCKAILDSPSAGFKTIVRLDTGEEVTVEPLTDEDRQMLLPLKGAAQQEIVLPDPDPATQEYVPDSTCQTCEGRKNMADGALTCPDCLGDGRQRVR
ncbi:MAG TPA: hypothetical protein VNH18_14835 [Bryobacteraceae bacterium]|nr:hypothetical protein [Bryobacteraceae bacterium]